MSGPEGIEGRGAAARLAALLPFLRPYRLRLLFAGAALLCATGTTLSVGLGVKKVVEAGAGAAGADPAGAALFLFGLSLSLAFFTSLRFTLISRIGEEVAADVRKAMHAKISAMEPGFFESAASGDLLTRIGADCDVVQNAVGSSLSMAARNVLSLFGAGLLMAAVDPKLACVMAAAVPAAVLPIRVLGRRVRRLSRAGQDLTGRLAATAEEQFHASATIHAFGRTRLEAERFGGAVDAVVLAARGRILARAATMACGISLGFGAVCLVLWIGGTDVAEGRIGVGGLSSFLFYAVLAATSLGGLSEVLGETQRAAGAAERIAEALALEPAVRAPAEPKAPAEPARGGLSFEDVRYAYPTRLDRPALDGFSLTALPGETTALVGPSGGGKSTVLKLALRFCDPQEGRVLLDGNDLRGMDPEAARSRMAFVPQDPVVFSASVLENILYGREGASKEEAVEAAKAAAALEFIEALPQGWDTPLGERGARLSGGQRQRIAIARAVLRDPVLLLLDEATSALDSESERTVQEALERLSEGRTTIVVAHRLSTVLRADRIVVVEDGRVAAQGTHADLVGQGGLYARLAALQGADGLDSNR